MERNRLEIEIFKHFGNKAEFAKFMGWSQPTASKVISGARRLKDNEIYKLEKVFKPISYAEFKEIFFTRILPIGKKEAS